MTTRTQMTTRAQRPSPEVERFPPLTTSLEALLQDGSDRTLRRLIYDLANLAALMVRNREHFAEYVGVTDPQFMMMSLVADAGGSTVGKIAEQLGVSSQFVTTEIAKLDVAGIIKRQPNEADRRSMILQLTQ